MIAPRRPTPEHVAELVARRTLGDIVSDELPDFGQWIESGYVTYLNLSGTPGLHLPTRNPVIRYSFWATTATPSSGPAPWLKAYDLANRLERRLQEPVVRGTFSPTANYLPFRIITAYPVTEPARVPNDPSGYARVDMSVLVKWAEVTA